MDIGQIDFKKKKFYHPGCRRGIADFGREVSQPIKSQENSLTQKIPELAMLVTNRISEYRSLNQLNSRKIN